MAAGIYTSIGADCSSLRRESARGDSIDHRDGYLIVVGGSVQGGYGLDMLIDTGAEYSVVDKRAVRRPGLTLIPQEVNIQALGRKTTVQRAVLPGLKLGSASQSFPCLAADIPFSDVDAIIGLDLLEALAGPG